MVAFWSLRCGGYAEASSIPAYFSQFLPQHVEEKHAANLATAPPTEPKLKGSSKKARARTPSPPPDSSTEEPDWGDDDPADGMLDTLNAMG